MSSIHSPASVIDEATLLAGLGISVPRQIVTRTPDKVHGARRAAAELPGSRVVVKITRPFLAHKTEAGGVRIVPNDAQAISGVIGDLALRLDAKEVAICEWIEHDTSPGGEILLAIRWSSEFGPLVTFGAGGTAAEVMSSVATLSPATTVDPLERISHLPFTELVTGHRNQRPRIAPADLRAFLARCLDFAESRLPQFPFDIEINPLVPTAAGLYALDVLVSPPEPSRRRSERPLAKIGTLLHPCSVAIMGVSATGMNAGRVIARNMNAQREASPSTAPRLSIVKEGVEHVEGIPCVPSLDALEPVDLLVLSISAAQIPEAIDRAIDRHLAESIIVIPGGLGEHEGSEDLERRIRESIARARQTSWGGPVINGANCLGVRTPYVDTIFLPREKWAAEQTEDVPLAIVSQSGALAISMVTRLAPLMPRHVVSIGNQLDLTAGDYLRYFETNDSIDVFAFYVEGFAPGDGRDFMEAARRLTADGKIVILYRAGRTVAGKRATSSHTAAIAGDASAARELASAARVIYADSLEDFHDLVRVAALLCDRRPRGLRLGAMSNAGFEAVASADNHGSLELAPLTGKTSDSIAALLRERRLDQIVTVANPLDVNPMLDDAAFAAVAELVLNDGNIDLGMIGCVPLTGALKTLPSQIDDADSIVARLIALRAESAKPWVAVVDAGPSYDPMVRRLEAARIPLFRTADRAVRILALWARACRSSVVSG
jgi:acyl-CoA synthetase (NDP forming)